eukprot:406350_1
MTSTAFNSHTDSIWFTLYTQTLQNSLKSVDSLQLQPTFKYACVAAILRLNMNYKYQSNNLNPLDILYIRRAIKKGDPWSGHIAFPGGRHENNESLQSTVEREVMEEIGLDISETNKHYKCLGYVHYMDLKRVNKTFRVICYVYIQCINTTPTLILCDKEVAEVAWINFKQFSQIPLNMNSKYMFDDKIWKHNSNKHSFDTNNGSGWTNMMNKEILTKNITNIATKITNHVDMKLMYSSMFLPKTSMKYPGIILHKNQDNENTFWLLWGMTYMFTGYVLDALGMTHYLRYNRVLRKRDKMKYAVLYYARIFKINLNVSTSGILPYFSSTNKYNNIKKAKL